MELMSVFIKANNLAALRDIRRKPTTSGIRVRNTKKEMFWVVMCVEC
jgi:hypothetical protein